MPEKVSETYRTKLGAYRGLEASLILHPLGGTEVVLDGAVRRRETLIRDNPGPRAVLNAMERLANGYEHERHAQLYEIAVKQGQLRDYEARLGKAFEHAAYQDELETLRDRLKLGLSEHAAEADKQAVAETAEKIQALLASNTVEAAPERTARKATRAEKPVTARIRERLVAVEAVEPPVEEVKAGPVMPEPVAVEPVAEPVAQVIALSEPVKPAESHQRAVTRRRQGDSRQLSLF